MEDTTQSIPFDQWLIQAKELGKAHKNFSQVELDMMDFEFDFWKSMYEEGLTPEQAILKDDDEE